MVFRWSWHSDCGCYCIWGCRFDLYTTIRDLWAAQSCFRGTHSGFRHNHCWHHTTAREFPCHICINLICCSESADAYIDVGFDGNAGYRATSDGSGWRVIFLCRRNWRIWWSVSHGVLARRFWIIDYRHAWFGHDKPDDSRRNTSD